MRSRLRKLHIDGREFVWKADIRAAPGPDGRRRRCIRVRVWGAGKNSRPLQVDLVERPRSAPDEKPYPYPMADDVRALVGYALTTGWTPEIPGAAFQFTSAAELALPRFVITDLLWAAEQHAGGR